jgi:hypothetical protein
MTKINDKLLLESIVLGDVATGGIIPVATVDSTASIIINQTTPGAVYTLANPTDTKPGKLMAVTSGATASFTMYGSPIAPNKLGLFLWKGTAWTALSSGSVDDFWRSGAGATTPPDGTTDLTESIRRNGLVGVNVDPTSEVTTGSLAMGILSVPASGGSTPFALGDHTIEVATGTPTHAVVLPSAVLFKGRECTIKLAAGNTGTQVTVTAAAGQAENFDGLLTASAVIAHPYARTATWQSDGANWQMVAASNTATSNAGAAYSQIYAKASINLGDPIPVGARPITNSFNVATATGIDGTGTDARMNVVFTTPLATTDYVVVGHLTGVVAANFNNDNEVVWQVTNKTAAGFQLSTRELTGVAQNINFDFMVLALTAAAGVPQGAVAKYVGPNTTTLASVTLGNFILRYNATTTNVEIATVAGTETIGYYSEVNFASAAFDTAGTALALTTTFQLIGDPGIILGAEKRTIWFSPIAAGDTRMFEFELLSPTLTKMAVRLKQW